MPEKRMLTPDITAVVAGSIGGKVQLKAAVNATEPATQVESPSSTSSAIIPFPGGDGDNGVTIWMPCAGDFDYNHPDDLPRNSEGKVCLSNFQKLKHVTSWQQLFQIGVAAAAFVSGAGVGRQVLREPLATAEGVMNYPVIVGQFAAIFNEVFLIDRTIYSWDTQAVVSLVDHISTIAAAFSIISRNGLEILFQMGDFPHSVHSIESYGGAALVHSGFVALHTVQAAVMKWNILVSTLKKWMLLTQGVSTGDLSILFWRDNDRTANYLKDNGWNPGAQMVPLDKNLKDAIQQSREVLRCAGAADPLHNYDLNNCEKLAKDQLAHITDVKKVGGHHHAEGWVAVIAETVAHGITVPIFFGIWLAILDNLPVIHLGVAWAMELITLALLGYVIHHSRKESMHLWKELGGHPPQNVKDELQNKLTTAFIPIYSRWIDKIEFSIRKVSLRSSSLFYVSFWVSAYTARWADFIAAPSDNSQSWQQKAAQDLRRLAYEVKAYDFSRLHDKNYRMVYFLFSDRTPPPDPLAPIPSPGPIDFPTRRRKGRREEKPAAEVKVSELDRLLSKEEFAAAWLQQLEGFDDVLYALKSEEIATELAIEKDIAPLYL